MSDTFTGETYSTLCDDAEEYLAKESPEQARELLLKAISLIGTRPRARSILADTCMSMELWSEAREQLETLITLEEGNINNHFRLAQVLEEIGEYQLSLDNYSVVLNEDPEHHGAEVAKKRIENRASQSGVNLADVFNTPTEEEIESSEEESEEEDIKEGMQIYPDVPSNGIFAESDEDEEDDDVDALLKNIGLSGDDNEAEREEDEVSELLANIGVSTSQALQSAFGDSDEGEGAEDSSKDVPKGEGETPAAEAAEKKKVVSLDEIFGTSASEPAAETDDQVDAGEAVSEEEEAEAETADVSEMGEEPEEKEYAEEVSDETEEAEEEESEQEYTEEVSDETAAAEQEESYQVDAGGAVSEEEEAAAETADVAEMGEEPEEQEYAEEVSDETAAEEKEDEESPFEDKGDEDKGGFVFGTSKTLEAIFSSRDKEGATVSEEEESEAETADVAEMGEEPEEKEYAEEVSDETEEVEEEESEQAYTEEVSEEEEAAAETADVAEMGEEPEEREYAEEVSDETEEVEEEESEQAYTEEVSEEEEAAAETADVSEMGEEPEEKEYAEEVSDETEEVEEEESYQVGAGEAVSDETEEVEEEESEQEYAEEVSDETAAAEREEAEAEKILLEQGADIRFDPWTPESGLLAVHMTSGELEIESSLVSFIEKTMGMESLEGSKLRISGEGTFLLNCGQYKPLVLETDNNMVIRKDSIAVHTGAISLELLDIPDNESLFVIKEDSKEIAVMKADRRTRVILLGGSNRVFFARRHSIVATDPGITLATSDSPEGFIEISGNGKVYLLE